jgi:hypothetical protein
MQDSVVKAPDQASLRFSSRCYRKELFLTLGTSSDPVTLTSGLFYWHREPPSSSAEVDYVVQYESSIIQLQVKASTKGRMQSLYRFLAEKNVRYAMRTSQENFSTIATQVNEKIVQGRCCSRLLLSGTARTG